MARGYYIADCAFHVAAAANIGCRENGPFFRANKIMADHYRG